MPTRQPPTFKPHSTSRPSSPRPNAAGSAPALERPAAPLVSCLCITDDREAFLPWLSWNFRRQTWPHRELVIVTGSAVPQSIADQPGVRVVEVARGTNVPAKRNVALDAAAGSIIAWTDDDDWQHPQRLERVVAALSGEAPIAGWASAWFVDLAQSRCSAYRGRERVLFNGAGFRTEIARSVRFDPRVPRGSDSSWLRGLTRGRSVAKILPGDDGFFWLCHDKNISNPARRRRFPESLDVLRGRLGEAWGETDAELEALRERIEQHRPPSTASRSIAVRSRAEVMASRARDSAPPSLPSPIPAAAVVKACALDAPFLGITVPHTSPPATVAPIAVVIPVRDRAGVRLQRCMASLAWQSVGRPLQTIVVSHGSRPDSDRELEALCCEQGATLLAIGRPSDAWCKPLALNVGLRDTDPALAFVMTLDADMILAPDFLETVLAALREQPRRMVLCRSSDLPREVKPPPGDGLVDAFAALRARASLRGFQGSGGIQAAPRSFFFEARGYDEDFVWWGAEDNDMVQRARLADLEVVWICDRTAMLHQWHPASVATTTDRRVRAEMLRARRRNHELARARAGELVRNTDEWGRDRPVPAVPPRPAPPRLIRSRPTRAASRVVRAQPVDPPLSRAAWDSDHEQRLRQELDRAARADALGEGRLIAVIVPVLARPDRVRPLLESFLAATRDNDAAIYFVAQASDAREVAAIRACGQEPLLAEDGDRSWARKINLGYARTREPWLLLAADDLAFRPDWIDVVRTDLLTHVGVIGTNDLGNPGTADGRHSTHPLVRRIYADVCGTVDERGKVVHDGYIHNFPDTELVATAKKRDLYLHRADCVIEHLHPSWGKAPRDHVYAIGRRSTPRDRALFNERAKRFGWS